MSIGPLPRPLSAPPGWSWTFFAPGAVNRNVTRPSVVDPRILCVQHVGRRGLRESSGAWIAPRVRRSSKVTRIDVDPPLTDPRIDNRSVRLFGITPSRRPRYDVPPMATATAVSRRADRSARFAGVDGAPGCGALTVALSGGQSRVTRAFAASPLRLLTPRNHGPASWIFTSTFGGGLVGGDAVFLEVDVDRRCKGVPFDASRDKSVSIGDGDERRAPRPGRAVTRRWSSCRIR